MLARLGVATFLPRLLPPPLTFARLLSPSQVLLRLGVATSQGRLHKETLERVFTSADTDGDAKVSFLEFMNLFGKEALSSS